MPFPLFRRIQCKRLNLLVGRHPENSTIANTLIYNLIHDALHSRNRRTESYLEVISDGDTTFRVIVSDGIARNFVALTAFEKGMSQGTLFFDTATGQFDMSFASSSPSKSDIDRLYAHIERLSQVDQSRRNTAQAA